MAILNKFGQRVHHTLKSNSSMAISIQLFHFVHTSWRGGEWKLLMHCSSVDHALAYCMEKDTFMIVDGDVYPACFKITGTLYNGLACPEILLG